MFDLKQLNSALDQLEDERGIPRDRVIEAIELALAAAYKRDYGKKSQYIKAEFDLSSGDTKFFQVKKVVDESMLKDEDDEAIAEGDHPQKDAESTQKNAEGEADEEEIKKVRFNEEHHIMLEDAKKIKKDVKIEDELTFPLEAKDDYGRIAAQTAKQVIIQKIREAEKVSVLDEFGKKAGEIVSGTVQRTERGNVFVDLGRATGILYRDEQIPGEFYRQGERIRAYLVDVEETPRGINLRLSRSHPNFVAALFAIESPEIASETVEIMGIAREAGSRTKMAIRSNDPSIDPVGSCVGQRGVRVSTVISELGGEKIDIIEWSELPEEFIASALSPGKIMSIELDEEVKEAVVTAVEDQLSLVIGKGGQNVRLAAKLTGWRIDVATPDGDGADPDEEDEKKEENETEDKEEKGENKKDKNEKEEKARDKEAEKEDSDKKDKEGDDEEEANNDEEKKEESKKK